MANTTSTTTSLISKIKDAFTKLFNVLIDIGLKYAEGTEDQLRSDVWPKDLTFYTKSGKTIIVHMDLSNGDTGKVDIAVKNTTDGGGFKKRNVLISDLADLLKKNADKLNLSADDEIETSMKFVASFHKITGSSDTTVSLRRICATTDIYPSDALAAIHSMLDNDDFVAQLPEDTEAFYEIADDGSEYSVEPCEACETSQFVSFSSIIGMMYCSLFNIQSIHWNTTGSEFHSVHLLSDDCIEMLRAEIDELAELCAQTQGCAPNPGTFSFTASPLCTVQPTEPFSLSCDEALAALMTELDEVSAMIELHYGNFDHATQSLLDNFLLDIGKKSHFFAGRQLAE